jgi:polysaccharide deacetylase family protein (PEP-CTERM system associated)
MGTKPPWMTWIKPSPWISWVMRVLEVACGVGGLFLLPIIYPVLVILKSKGSFLSVAPRASSFFLNLIRGRKRPAVDLGRDRRLDRERKTGEGTLSGIPKVLNFLTVDVECWFHAYNIGDKIPRSTWHLQETQILQTMDRLLLLLQAHDTKATFFVLGWVADHFPEVVRMIAAEGHEIGTHGYHHELITRMTPQEFETDLLRSLEAINRNTSQEVLGHRASNFTVVRDTLWALEILAKNGIHYDSSVFPIARKRYGIPTYPQRYPHTLRMPDGRALIELPLSTTKLGNKLLPVAGGGYFRLYPYNITQAYIEKTNLRGMPAMVYLHPWELDVDQARYFLGATKTFQHYVNLESTERKLDRLLDRFSFGSIKQGLPGVRDLIRENVVPLSEIYEDSEATLPNLRWMLGKRSGEPLEEAELSALVD